MKITGVVGFGSRRATSTSCQALSARLFRPSGSERRCVSGPSSRTLRVSRSRRRTRPVLAGLSEPVRRSVQRPNELRLRVACSPSRASCRRLGPRTSAATALVKVRHHAASGRPPDDARPPGPLATWSRRRRRTVACGSSSASSARSTPGRSDVIAEGVGQHRHADRNIERAEHVDHRPPRRHRHRKDNIGMRPDRIIENWRPGGSLRGAEACRRWSTVLPRESQHARAGGRHRRHVGEQRSARRRVSST